MVKSSDTPAVPTTERRKFHENGRVCSCCYTNMPRDPEGHDVSVGWLLLRAARHGQTEVEVKHYLLCPNCTLTFSPKQTDLFSKRQPPATPSSEPTP